MHMDDTTADAEISSRVRVAMARRRYNASQLGQAAGFTKQLLHRKLNGLAAWRATEVWRVAAVLEVPVGELFPVDLPALPEPATTPA